MNASSILTDAKYAIRQLRGIPSLTMQGVDRVGRAIDALERIEAAAKEQVESEEQPPDEGPNYRDFPSDEDCYDMEAQDEMAREDATGMSYERAMAEDSLYY